MAHKKGLGSSRNGRDSNAQRLGVKTFAGADRDRRRDHRAPARHPLQARRRASASARTTRSTRAPPAPCSSPPAGADAWSASCPAQSLAAQRVSTRRAAGLLAARPRGARRCGARRARERHLALARCGTRRSRPCATSRARSARATSRSARSRFRTLDDPRVLGAGARRRARSTDSRRRARDGRRASELPRESA